MIMVSCRYYGKDTLDFACLYYYELSTIQHAKVEYTAHGSILRRRYSR